MFTSGTTILNKHAGSPSQTEGTVDSANGSINMSMHSSNGEGSKANFQNKGSPCVGKPSRASARLAQKKK